jgi:hypothetical protein
MTLRKRGIEYQEGHHRRSEGDEAEEGTPEGIRLDTDLSGDGRPAEPAGDWDDED